MRTKHTLRRDPLLALGLLAIVLATLWFVALAPVLGSFSTTQAELAGSRERAADLSARIEALKTERDAFVAIDISRMQWRADQIGEASAQVQASVTNMAREAKTNLRAITPIPSGTLAGQDAIAIRLEGEAAMDALVSFIESIETHQPLLVIDHTILRRLNRPDHRREQPLVFFQLTILAPVYLNGGS